MKKQCTCCNEILPLDKFGNQKQGKYGKRSTCKKCKLQADKDYSKTKEGLITQIYTVQKRSSKKRGHNNPEYSKDEFKMFLLNNDDFNDLYMYWKENNYDRMITPSVDRLDNRKGYSFDNIQIVTWLDNIRLYDGSHSFKEVYQYDKDGNFIKKYKNGREASIQTGVSRASISLCCNNKQQQSKGFIWKFSPLTQRNI